MRDKGMRDDVRVDLERARKGTDRNRNQEEIE